MSAMATQGWVRAEQIETKRPAIRPRKGDLPCQALACFAVLAHIFFSLMMNLAPKVRKMATMLAQNHLPLRRFVITRSSGSLTTRSAEETAVKRVAFRSRLAPVLDLNTRNSFRAKLASIATWLLRNALTRRTDSP